jgi:hypothetical protein
MLFVVFLLGCKDEPPVGNTVVVPIKVWIVLEERETDQDELGHRDNTGCRLERQEVIDHVRHLQANALKLYGGDVRFQWDENPEVVHHRWTVPHMDRIRQNNVVDAFVAANPPGHWTPGAINIYFVGNMQGPDPITQKFLTRQVGFSFDPADAAAANPPLRPYVAINDGGFDLPQGFMPLFSPEEMRRYNVILHEMTHFLGRLNNPRGRIWEGRTYDDYEHANYGRDPTKLENILRPSTEALVPAPLVIPGRIDRSNTEKGDIWIRIATSRWSEP